MMMDFDLDNIQQKFFLGFYFTLHITRGVGCFSIVIIIGRCIYLFSYRHIVIQPYMGILYEILKNVPVLVSSEMSL